MLKDFGAIGILMVLAMLVPIGGLLTSALIHPKKPTPEKLLPYECGVDPIGESWVQFKASYYLYALVFVVFDVETIFLYPWAVKFQTLGTFAFVEMMIFMAILTVGLWYAWKKGALLWK